VRIARTLGRATSTVIETLEDRRLLSTSYSLVDTIKAPTPQEEQFFGQSMAASGNLVVVGAQGHDSLTGEAYLVDATTGSIIQTLANPDPDPSDAFGASVAFVGGDILVGAPGDNAANGKAYLFDTDGNLLQTFDNPVAGPNQFFGQSVGSFGGDVLVQTAQDNSGPIIGGLVSQFTTGGTFVQSFTNPDRSTGDAFGQSVASVGGNVLFGAPGADQAFLFDGSGNLLQTFDDPSGGGSSFGSTVAFLGGNALIGAPTDGSIEEGAGAVHLMDVSDASLIQTYNNPDAAAPLFAHQRFGDSLAFIGDDIVIGSSGATTPIEFIDPETEEPFLLDIPVGAVYVIDAATGDLEAKIENPTPQNPDEQLTGSQPFDFFSRAVAVADGKIFVSDPSDNSVENDSGTVFVFEEDAGPANQPPTAEAGAYAAVDENGNVLLDASGSTDPDGFSDIVTFEWDLDNNGSYETSGQTANFSQDLPGAYTVGLRVTDSENNVSTDTASITFNDVVPAADGGADQTVVSNQTVNLSGAGNNAAGVAITGYAWDLDNNGSFETSGQNVSTSFAATGSYTVNFQVTDDDGQTATDSVTINVVTAGLQGGDLYIGGTNGNDDFDVNDGPGGSVKVKISGVLIGTFSPTGKIVILGGAGNDDLKIAVAITLPSEIYGGAGDDTIRGGGGNDILFGGADNDEIKARGAHDVALGETGNDLVTGGDGRDILIGGTGADKVVGNVDDDILIAGSTSHDADLAALDAIRNEWMSGNAIATRVNNIRNGGGLNGSFTFTPDTTVFDDDIKDTLAGGQGTDWFFFNADGENKDKVTGLNSGDFQDDLDFILE
jgi:hypothetical protein